MSFLSTVLSWTNISSVINLNSFVVVNGFDISVIAKHTQPSAVINTTEASASPLIAVLTYEAGFRAENILVALICFSSVLVAVHGHCLLIFYLIAT